LPEGEMQFFQPQLLPISQDSTLYAAQFRGRGILAKPLSVNGQVFLYASQGSTITAVDCFDRVLEWRHTHQPTVVDGSSSRVSKALDWFEVAAILHE
jgi:hypothetical protein